MVKKKARSGLKQTATTKQGSAKSAVQGTFQDVLDTLKPMIVKYESRLVVVHDEAGKYDLDTPFIDPKNKKPVFFAAVARRKNDIAFYNMPVYCFPELLEGMSPELKKRMQGKSCFNFKAVDKPLFRELDKLVKAGVKQYEKASYIKRGRS